MTWRFEPLHQAWHTCIANFPIIQTPQPTTPDTCKYHGPLPRVSRGGGRRRQGCVVP